jgi:hypothetical protein
MHKAKIDYDKKTLDITLDDIVYPFDLNDGDIGQFIHSLKHNEQVYDVDYTQEDESRQPSVTLYPVTILGEESEVDYVNYISIDSANIETYGEPKNYFGEVTPMDWDALYNHVESKL